MKRIELTAEDLVLVRQARKLIALRYQPEVHVVSSVLRTKTGQVFEGIHLEAYVGRMAICAEAIALGTAATQGDSQVDVIVAVYHTGKVVAPCGMCRELIAGYAADAQVILEDEEGLFKTLVSELLPLKYQRQDS
jgi:cytidine deaminase